jgi:GPH family glycoside/pentoside/hexuronide:cation symporter
MLADVAEEHELRTGERRDGAIFGAFSAGLQMAAGLGVTLAGFLLDYFAGVVPGTTAQTPATIVRIGVLSCIVPGALSVTAALLILSYDLTRRRVSVVKALLSERRSSSQILAGITHAD